MLLCWRTKFSIVFVENSAFEQMVNDGSQKDERIEVQVFRNNVSNDKGSETDVKRDKVIPSYALSSC